MYFVYCRAGPCARTAVSWIELPWVKIINKNIMMAVLDLKRGYISCWNVVQLFCKSHFKNKNIERLQTVLTLVKHQTWWDVVVTSMAIHNPIACYFLSNMTLKCPLISLKEMHLLVMTTKDYNYFIRYFEEP